jgi:hypothetical protein
MDFLLSGKPSVSPVVVRLRVGLAGRRIPSRADACLLRGCVGLSKVDSSRGVDSVAAFCPLPLVNLEIDLLTGACSGGGWEDWRRRARDCLLSW